MAHVDNMLHGLLVATIIGRLIDDLTILMVWGNIQSTNIKVPFLIKAQRGWVRYATGIL